MPFSFIVNSSMLFVPLLPTLHGPDYSHVITATFKGDKELSPPHPSGSHVPNYNLDTLPIRQFIQSRDSLA